MGTINIYHGSGRIVAKPVKELSVPHNDFGSGFYCTESFEGAGYWACRYGKDGFINEYKIQTDGLNVLDFSSEKLGLMNWVALVAESRLFKKYSETAEKFCYYLRGIYLPDAKKADIITGMRCDDSYFSITRMFIENKISYQALKAALVCNETDRQFVLKSKKAFEALRFLSCARADNLLCYPKRMINDKNARERLASFKPDGEQLFAQDFMNERIRPEDVRL